MEKVQKNSNITQKIAFGFIFGLFALYTLSIFIPFLWLFMPIYYFSACTKTVFCPTDYVDITEENELKVKAMLCHKSQIEWLGEHDGDNPVEAMQAQSMAYGKMMGVRHAEAFVKCPHDCRLACKHLLP